MTLPSSRVLGALALLATAACASSGGGVEEASFDPSLPLACIDIDNRQGSGTMERLYLVEADRRASPTVSSTFSGGTRQGEGVRIGDAPVGRVTRFCTQNVQLPGRYFIRVEQAPSDNFDPANQNQGSVGSFSSQRQARMIESEDVVLEPGDLWTWEVRRDRWTCQPDAAAPGGGDC